MRCRPMFIRREKVLKALSAGLSTWEKKTAVLIHGKRRVGKPTLISEAVITITMIAALLVHVLSIQEAYAAEVEHGISLSVDSTGENVNAVRNFAVSLADSASFASTIITTAQSTGAPSLYFCQRHF